MNLDYRFRARLTETVELGPVDGGIRVDNYFASRMTHGELVGPRPRRDQICIARTAASRSTSAATASPIP